MYTISNYRPIRNYLDYPCIELPNGAKCNPGFYWLAVHYGILDPDKD